MGLILIAVLFFFSVRYWETPSWNRCLETSIKPDFIVSPALVSDGEKSYLCGCVVLLCEVSC